MMNNLFRTTIYFKRKDFKNMFNLSTKIRKQYYLIKNGVVFEIKNTSRGDSCEMEAFGVAWEEVKDENGKVIDHVPNESMCNIPFIKITNNNVAESADTMNKVSYLYLDAFITDGDLYGRGGSQPLKFTIQASEQGSIAPSQDFTFLKVIHSDNRTEEETTTLYGYYMHLLEKEILSFIRGHFNKGVEWFLEADEERGIQYINFIKYGFPSYLFGNGYTVEGISQLSFTEYDIEMMKKQCVIEDIKSAVDNVLNYYGYELVNELEFDVQPKQDGTIEAPIDVLS